MAKADLVIWSSDPSPNEDILKKEFQVWADKFAAGSTLEIQHKETETERTDFMTAGLAGSGLPDMMLGPNDPIGVYVDSGLLQELDDKFDISKYPFNIGAAQVGGKTYGIPTFAGNHLMLMYNKKFVKEAPDTWADLIKVAKQVQTDNPKVQGFEYNLVEPFWFVPFVYGFGGSVYDKDGKMTLDTQPWVDAYQFVHDLKFKDQVVPAECDSTCADGQFKEGSVAMILNGDWAISDYLDTTKSSALGQDNLGIAPWPKLDNGNRPQPFTSGKFISIPVGVEGDKLAAVVSFVTWLTTDPDAVKAFAIDTGRLPAIAGIEIDAKTNPILAASNAVLQTGVGMPADSSLRCMWDSVRPQLQGVMADSIQPADAAKAAQTAADACLKKS
jgi:maltose-binding protein MalE